MQLKAYRHYIIPILALICILALFFIGEMPQDLSYHNFSDGRNFFGIPNCLNVLSNLPFGVVAILGFRQLKQPIENKLYIILITLYSAFLLLTFGSAYYHLTPSNETLVYDRIPIVIIIISFFSLLIYDRISQCTGYYSFLIMNLIGALTVVYWYITERFAIGDLRWYALTQFFPILAIPFILILYKSRFKYGKDVVLIYLYFMLAKLAETYDREIYDLLNNTLSGHTIKHLLMAGAGYEILNLIHRRFHFNSQNDQLE